MKCRYSDHEIALWIEGDLPPEKACDIEKHLSCCDVCRELAASLRESQLMLKSLKQDTVSAAALSSIRTRVLAEIRGMRFRWPCLRWAYATAGAIFVVVVGFIVAARMPEPVPLPATVQIESPVPEGLHLKAREIPVSPPAPEITLAKSVPRRRPRAARPDENAGVAQAVNLPDSAKPLVIKLLTDDPAIVIYWLVDQKDGGTL